MQACSGIRVDSTYHSDFTYHTEGADELLRRLNASCDNHLDKVGGDANNDDHADGLEDANQEEHLAQGHSSIARDRHDG